MALCGLASSWSLHQQHTLIAGSDICQLLQHCNILQAPLLATLVLSAITPSVMHISEVTLYQLTVARGILDLQKPATISVKEGINRILQLTRAWHRDILHKSVPFCNFPYFKGLIPQNISICSSSQQSVPVFSIYGWQQAGKAQQTAWKVQLSAKK